MLVIVFGASFASVACTQSSAEPRDASGSAVVEPGDPSEPIEPGDEDPSDPPAARPRFVSLAANGTGCPNDATWEATIAEDGQSAEVRLHAYDAHVAPGEAFSIRDCTVLVTVEGAEGHRYALGDVSASGWASLQGEGMCGEETLKYYVQGDPVRSESRVHELASGAGARYDFGAQLVGGDVSADDETAVWSPCGGGRALVVQGRKILRNNPEKTGYGFAGGSVIRLSLASRSCASE